MLVYAANSQILITLLLGDKLNSPKIEFGLDGGWNMPYTYGLDGANPANRFNLGFYFDFKIFKTPKLMLHTGLIVKSSMGSNSLPVYTLNNPELDTAFVGGRVERKIKYFNLPIMMKYNFVDQLYIEGGVMVGLKYKAFDEFTNKVIDKKDLNYKLDIKKKIHPIDIGVIGGIGYKFLKGKGLSLGVRYYYSFVDNYIDDSTPKQFNSSLYVTVMIPMGGAKAKKKTDENQ